MKKMMRSFLICGAVLLAGSWSYAQDTAVTGDINDDGLINLGDAVLALQVLVFPGEQYGINLNAEVNKDMKIGLEEAIYVLQKLCLLYPASCIENLDSWKLGYLPRNSDCTKCHTTCTPASAHSFCSEGNAWGKTESGCLSCHPSVHESSQNVDEYLVFAWNDLGMHCLNPTYNTAVILPPYNTIQAQVIKKASLPEVVTSGITVEYGIQNNTYSYGKRDYGQFWDHAEQLFGVALERDKGLNLEDPDIHNGLSGVMVSKSGRFQADGIPVTPVNDDLTWDPYQIGEIIVKDSSGTVLAQTQATVPVSDEINCAKCHGTDAAFTNILQKHDEENHTSLVSQAPVLCADCHGSPALGSTTAGSSGSYLSEAVHGEHADKSASCYDCHPGQASKCNRSVAHTGTDGNCVGCHGTMEQVASSIEQGRIPWVNEPKCVTCHAGVAEVDTGDTLFRNATGHGGLHCTVCHGSPHAMVPSSEDSDNYQAIQYQGQAKTIGGCGACHSGSKGPESKISEFPDEHGGASPAYSTSCNICHTSVSSETAKWPHAYKWKSRTK